MMSLFSGLRFWGGCENARGDSSPLGTARDSWSSRLTRDSSQGPDSEGDLGFTLNTTETVGR